MSLSDLASLGSLVSGLAVLVSLAYMTLQLRQTDRNQRALLTEGALTRVADTVMWLGQPETAALLDRAAGSGSDLSGPDLWQLAQILRVSVINLQDARIQHGEGLVDRATLENAERGFLFWMRMPVMRRLYNSAVRPNVAAEIRPYLDALIEKAPPPAPYDIRAFLQGALPQT